MAMQWQAHKGRGALSNPAGRFEAHQLEVVDDGWGGLEQTQAAPETELRPEICRSIISTHDSPDIPFAQSINPYRGCSHGCIYCYARPSHAYVNLSPGLDFETKIFFKQGAAARLEEALRRPGYRCRVITIGANTDPYQPAERGLRITRQLLQVLLDYRHPVALITKSTLVLRDLDLLRALAARRLVSVVVTVTTLDPGLKRRLEPQAAAPAARLEAIRRLAAAGVPVNLMAAPMIPALNDCELERILEKGAQAGARRAGYVLLRLPHEVKTLFREWLAEHYPERAEHVMSLIRQARGGKDYDSRFGLRMRGTGVFADLLARRFAAACRRYGLNDEARDPGALDTRQFRRPPRAGDQLGLL